MQYDTNTIYVLNWGHYKDVLDEVIKIEEYFDENYDAYDTIWIIETVNDIQYGT